MAPDRRPIGRNFVLVVGAAGLVVIAAVMGGFFQSCGDTTPGDTPVTVEPGPTGLAE